MGGEVSSTLVQLSRIDTNWKMHSRTKHATNILIDPNGRLAQETLVQLTGSTSLTQQLEEYNFRRTQSIGMVRVYAAMLLTPKYFCGCGSGPALKVITEYLPHRLFSVAPLTQHEAMYVLAQSLRIFRQIFLRKGAIQIDEDLFGFTQQGKVRVWCNPNFADNSPARQILTEGEDKKTEAYMVEKIIDIVQQNTINRRLPNSFNRIFNSLAYLDFNMAQKGVADYIRNLKDEYLPDHVDLQHFTASGQRVSIEVAPDMVVTEVKTEIFRYEAPLPPVIQTVTVEQVVSGSQMISLPQANVMRVSFANVPVTTSFTNKNIVDFYTKYEQGKQHLPGDSPSNTFKTMQYTGQIPPLTKDQVKITSFPAPI